jgi:hypothetical protein
MKGKFFAFYFLLFTFCLLQTSCKEETVNAADYTCKALSPFVKNTGLDPARSAFSTSETRIMGLVLKEFSNNNSVPAKIYQHSSWKMGGWLSPIQIDKFGNIYTAPAPFISVLDNPIKNQNTIYKVNGTDGVMTEFIKLPMPDSLTNRNPFGIVSIAFNCKKNILYVSSVAGSTAQKEMGCLYVIDLEKKAIVDKITGMDFFGIQLVVADDKLRLLSGSTRNSNIYSIKINGNGRFASQPEIVASIEGLGLRGDDKVKKIIFKGDGQIQVKGLEFNYNLIAPTEKQESTFNFIYDMDLQKWALQI